MCNFITCVHLGHVCTFQRLPGQLSPPLLSPHLHALVCILPQFKRTPPPPIPPSQPLFCPPHLHALVCILPQLKWTRGLYQQVVDDLQGGGRGGKGLDELGQNGSYRTRGLYQQVIHDLKGCRGGY